MNLPQFKKLFLEIQSEVPVRKAPQTTSAKSGTTIPSKFFTDPWAGEITSYDAVKYLEKYKEPLEKAGVKISKTNVIGGGAQGQAVDIGNSVVKVTKDRMEANACYRIKGKKLKNVYNIYNVYELDNEHVYVIHQEKLEPLDKFVYQNWSRISWAISDYSKHPEDKKILSKEYINYIENMYGDAPERKKKLLNVFQQMLNAIDELKQNRIRVADRHEENVLQRNDGTVVLIDLGLSKSPEIKIPKAE